MKRALRIAKTRKGVRLRKLVYQVLWAIDRGVTTETVLEKFRSPLRERRDRDLLTEMVQGVLRYQGLLDYIMHRLMGGSYYTLHPSARILIRVGLYQILFMDKIPAYAAVHTTVEASRHLTGISTKVVNAVLRKAVGIDWMAMLPDRQADPIDYLAVRYSFPKWIVTRWVSWWGEEKTESVLQALVQKPPLYIRRHLPVPDGRFVDLLRQEDLVVERMPDIPDCFRVIAGSPQRTRAFRKGYFAVQDAASQMAAHLVNVRPGDRLLDACAAPGNKTTRFLQQMGYQGTVVIADISESRMQETIANLYRWLQRRRLQDARMRVGPVVADMRTPPFQARARFDWVVVDAPCSNLGVAHRHPELKWRLTPEAIRHLADLQRGLLEGVAHHVRPEGYLVYTVCTLEREETYEVVQAFLEARPDFRLVRLDRGDWPPLIRRFVEDHYYWIMWPDQQLTDGFFGVVFQRVPR